MNIKSLCLLRFWRILYVSFFLFLLPSINTIADAENIIITDLQVPYGVSENGLLLQNSTVSGLLKVESHYEDELKINLSLIIPKPLIPLDLSEIDNAKVEYANNSTIINNSFNLVTEYDSHYNIINIKIPENAPTGIYTIYTVCNIAYADGTKEPRDMNHLGFKKEIKVKVITREQLQSIIKIKDIRIPADEEGNKDPKAEPNTILLKDSNKWKYINKILLKSSEDKLSTPASYVGIELENTGKENLIILATLNILDLRTKELVSGFRPPAHGEYSGGNKVYSNILIPSSDSIVIALPIYAEEGEVLSGKYIVRIEAKIFGSNQDIYREDIIIKVVSRNYFSFLITLIAIATALFLLLFLFFSFNLVLESFKTSQLILIALFGTATFVSVNIPGTILFDLVPVLLGPFSPFSFIITGIFYEIILYMLIMALVMLVPRVGVVTLANVVRFLMNGFILGHFNPVFLL
ncbi:MAG TPA: hypothetical protein EYP22_09535, partial [Methanosarcinales archaeon]|nr:hypothetical protein [Methanosarcinales archaeon]